MIRFIYGESGSGKTHRVSELIKKDIENGIHTFLIVPDQQAVSSERMMLSLLPPSAQLELEILSFSRLYNRVCREYGGLEYSYLTKPAKQLIMWRTVKELAPMLAHYHTVAERDPSTPERMLSAVMEFKANGISARELERAADKLPKDSELSSKLYDLSLIYSAYSAFISEGYGDSADDISKLDGILASHSFFDGANVYIDSFTSYTSAEHSVIEKIFASAENVTVTLPLPFERAKTVWSESISEAESKLIKAANNRGGYTAEALSENKRAKYPSLAFLSKNVWSFGSADTYLEDDAKEAIVLERCRTPYAEAEAAARWARELTRRGMRCRDILVVTSDANKYRGIIEPAFERNGIPYYLSEKSELSSRSLLKFIISAFRIKKYGWRTTDVISHVKTGMYDISRSDCDLFESYVTTWNIRKEGFLGDEWTMNPDGYNKEISERGKRILAAANSVRENLCASLLPLFTELDAADSPKEMCASLYSFLENSGAKQRLAEIGKRHAERGELKEANEYASLYSATLEAIATVAELLPEEKMSTEEFSEALKTVFDTTEIGTIPTSVDEVVIGTASMLRADSPRCVIVLGLCEGEFPRPVTDAGVLNFTERKELSELDLTFSASAETRASDELMFIQRAFSLPSELLILTTAQSKADRSEKRPSLPYNRVKALFPTLSEHIFDENDLSYLSPSANASARYVWSADAKEQSAALRSSLASYSGEYARLCEKRPQPVTDTSASIDESTAAALFPRKMTLTQSRLEKYVKCHFSYYCSYILGLRQEKRAEFGMLDIGNFVHYLLEHMLKAMLGEDGKLIPISEEELSELAQRTVSDYTSLVLPTKERSSGRLIHLCERLKKLSILLAKNIIEEFSHSEFTPAFFELKIGNNEGETAPLEFVLSDSSRVSLRGIIDRVDIYRKDGNVYVRVVDYKTGSKSFSIDDLALGLNTQMLLYLFALCARSDSKSVLRTDTPPIPSGVVYLSSNIPTLELEDYADDSETEKKAAAAFDRSGLLLSDNDILEAMNDEFSPAFLAGIKKNKQGEPTGEALTSLEKFNELRTEVETTICDIVAQMKGGNANAEPLVHKGESPCDHCEMKPICRITDNRSVTFTKNSEEKED